MQHVKIVLLFVANKLEKYFRNLKFKLGKVIFNIDYKELI